MAEVKLIPGDEKLELDVQVGTDDIVNIGVAEYENNLREQVNAAKREWQSCKTARDAAAKKCDAEAEKLVHATYGKQTKALAKALQDLKFAHKVKLEVLRVDDEDQEVLPQVQIDGATAYPEPIDFTPAVQKAVDASKQAYEDEQAAKKELVRLQGELQNLPYVERQIRAQVSKAAVLGSKQGTKLMAALGKAKIVPSLPG